LVALNDKPGLVFWLQDLHLLECSILLFPFSMDAYDSFALNNLGIIEECQFQSSLKSLTVLFATRFRPLRSLLNLILRGVFMYFSDL
jgi:hypothetical protein